MDIPRCLRTIDHWAEEIRGRTARTDFRRKPKHWKNSWAIYRIHVMISVLHKRFGVRYNPAKIPLDVPFTTEDCFVYGIIQGKGGTCASLPVLYVAIGRRLGYPLKLVNSRGEKYGHLFFRWEDPKGERFNIEVNNKGWDCPPDDHYRQGIFRTRPEWEQSGTILKSMTRREELANFLFERAVEWREAGQHRLQVEALAWASALAPNNLFHIDFLKQSLNTWLAQHQKVRPPHWPDLYIKFPPRRYPDTLPLELERDIIGKTITEFLLKDPINEREWWGPMRRGVKLARQLKRINVDCTPTGYTVQMVWDDSPVYQVAAC